MITAHCPRCRQLLRIHDDCDVVACPSCKAQIRPKPKQQAKTRPEQFQVGPPAASAFSFDEPSEPLAAPEPVRRIEAPSSKAPWIIAAFLGAIVLTGAAVLTTVMVMARGPGAGQAKAKEPAKANSLVEVKESTKPAVSSVKVPEPKPPVETEPKKKEPTPFQLQAKKFCEEGLVFLNLLDTEPPIRDLEDQLRQVRDIYARIPFSDDEAKAEKQRKLLSGAYKALLGLGTSYAFYRDLRLQFRDIPREQLEQLLKDNMSDHLEMRRLSREILNALLATIEGKKKAPKK